jgi:hypothetical protein
MIEHDERAMNNLDIEHFETQAAETIGAMKALFREFEDRLGEVTSAQRLANSEARNEAAKSRAAFEELVRQAKNMTASQEQAITELRAGWRMHVTEDSRAAGGEIARAFGVQIAGGLRQQLEALGAMVQRATERFAWVSVLKWTPGIALAIVLMTALGIFTLLPRVPGLSWQDLRVAAETLQPCEVDRKVHVCIAIDPRVRWAKNTSGETIVVVQGM